MPVLAGRTREQIRRSIGYNLMGPQFIVSTTTRASNNTTEIFDRDRLYGGNNVYNGRWAYMTSGSNDGEIRRVNDFVQGTAGDNGPGSHVATVTPGYTANVANAVTYEFWEQRWDPRAIEEYINQSILEAYGRAFDPEEDISLHTGGGAIGSTSLGLSRAGGGTSRYSIPSSLDAIKEVWYRERINSTEIHAFDRLFDETTNANVTQVVDDQDFRRGGAALRLTIGIAGLGAIFVTDAFNAIDLSGRTTVEIWMKSTIALTAGDWVLRLDDATVQGDSTDLEILSIPAINADTWTRLEILLANPELDTAIVSVGVEMNVDRGAHVVWFDDADATDPATAHWVKLSRKAWSLEREAGFLILNSNAVGAVGYAQLKLIGGGAPVLLTADATVTELSAWWIIARATELAFSRAGAEFKGDAILWGDKAKRAYRGLNRLRGARRTA